MLDLRRPLGGRRRGIFFGLHHLSHLWVVVLVVVAVVVIVVLVLRARR